MKVAPTSRDAASPRTGDSRPCIFTTTVDEIPRTYPENEGTTLGSAAGDDGESVR